MEKIIKNCEGETSEQLRELLIKGQIKEFNKNRRRFGFPPLNLQSEHLSGANLMDADLRGAKNISISKEEAKQRGAIVD